jgi:hypothetical protein
MGPVLPLYLNLQETHVLALAVEICTRLDSAVLVDEEARLMAEEQILEKYGVGGVARADRSLAAARERLPILRSLYTALAELGTALERTEGQDGSVTP